MDDGGLEECTTGVDAFEGDREGEDDFFRGERASNSDDLMVS
jgi:hypothetical protein